MNEPTGQGDETPQTITPRAFQRERAARKEAERLLDVKSTELFAAQDALRRANEDLERRVAERTRELSLAVDAAQAASRAKSEFLARMSHELRTPLNGVIAMNDLLLTTGLDERQRRHAEVAGRSGRVLLHLVNDILDFSKIEAGKLELHPEPFCPRQLVEDVVESFASQASAKSIDVSSFVDPAVPQGFLGDAARVRQVLVNLVGNAVKFTDRGHVAVGVTPAQNACGGVRVTVADSGPGIAGDHLSSLFKVFSQVDGSSTRRHRGTGLGLAITRQLAELMGGAAGVESEVGVGSTFWVELPLPSASRPPAPVVGDPPRSAASALHVLVVDADATRNAVLRRQVESWRFAASSEATIASVMPRLFAERERGTPVDVILADAVGDPDAVDELAMSIRADVRLAETTVMIVVAFDQLRSEAELEVVGIAGQLARPVRQSSLFDSIMRAVHGIPRGSAAEVTSRNDPLDLAPADALRGLNVLVAEDVDVNRMVIEELLGLAGVNVTLAEDGQQALDMVASRRFDLVLMDCQMPVMDGFDATRAIRQAERATGRHVPVIALTANALQGDRELCLAAGMDDYLTKPIEPETLYRVIQKHAPRAGGLAAGDPASRAA